MLEGLDKLRAILQGKLSDDEVEKILTELTVASGEGSVSIDGDATEAIIVTGDRNVIGDNNKVVINHGTDVEVILETLDSIARNIKAANSQAVDRTNRKDRGKVAAKNTATVAKPPSVKKSTRSSKPPNVNQTLRISKNFIVLNNTRLSTLARIKAVKEIGKDAKGNNSAISRLLSLIQKRDENNDLIAAGITALAEISDGRDCIVTTIVRTLGFNHSSSVVISAMNAFGKIGIDNSDAADKMVYLLSNPHNTVEMKESIIENLGKVANGHKKAIESLISILKSNQELIKTRKLAADSLVEIEMGDSGVSSAMADLLTDKKLSISFRNYIAVRLKKIAPSNPKLAAYLKSTTKK
jgi:hypothetical protein